MMDARLLVAVWWC